MLPSLNTPIPCQLLEDELLQKRNLKLSVLRTDLVSPMLSGNKFYKLFYNLQQAKQEGFSKILTFGGAFSNHIFATANAGKIFDFQTIGIIRGEEHLPLNPVLSHAKKVGMQIYYLNRTAYRQKNSPEILAQLQKEFGNFFLIPEGGSNANAVQGCAEISQHFPPQTDFICCACGTGGTLTGLIVGSPLSSQKIGFSVLKGGDFLRDEVKKFIRSYQKSLSSNNSKEINEKLIQNWSIQTDYHFGGYAKQTPDLLNFIDEFYQKHQIPLDPIYTGKLFYGIFDLIEKDFFPKKAHIVAIHTGGVIPLYSK